MKTNMGMGATPAGPWAVCVRAVRYSYPGAARPALDGCSLRVPEGSLFGLLGPNGAGKTTLIAMLCGILAPQDGEIEIMGLRPQRQARTCRRLLGLAPQEIAVYRKMSARENLRFFGSLHGFRGRSLHERIKTCLEFAGLEEWADRPAGTLSGGMLRRLNLAMALVHEPRLLLLDEPTEGMDAGSRRHVHARLSAMRRAGITMLLTTHSMDEADRLCSHVGIIAGGKLVGQGRAKELLARHGCADLETLVLSLTRNDQAGSDMEYLCQDSG